MGQPQTDLKTLLQQNGQPEAVPEAKTETKRKSPVAPSREGKVAIQGHFSKQTHDQLRILGIETGKKNQELLRDALNALFTMHNKPPIA